MKKDRHILLALALALSLAASGFAYAAAEAATAQAADLYFENGVIYTADSSDSVAGALAVKDGRIVFVGTAEDGKAYKDAAVQVIDLEGNMLLPGLIDGHLHSVAPCFFDFDLSGVTSVDEPCRESGITWKQTRTKRLTTALAILPRLLKATSGASAPQRAPGRDLPGEAHRHLLV